MTIEVTFPRKLCVVSAPRQIGAGLSDEAFPRHGYLPCKPLTWANAPVSGTDRSWAYPPVPAEPQSARLITPRYGAPEDDNGEEIR